MTINRLSGHVKLLNRSGQARQKNRPIKGHGTDSCLQINSYVSGLSKYDIFPPLPKGLVLYLVEGELSRMIVCYMNRVEI